MLESNFFGIELNKKIGQQITGIGKKEWKDKIIGPKILGSLKWKIN